MMPLQFPATPGEDVADGVVELRWNTNAFARDDQVYDEANALLGGSAALAELVAASASATALKLSQIA